MTALVVGAVGGVVAVVVAVAVSVVVAVTKKLDRVAWLLSTAARSREWGRSVDALGSPSSFPSRCSRS